MAQPQVPRPPVPIRPAATTVLLRDGPSGLEVLMQQRNPDAVFAGGAWVFPGGKLDPQDREPAWAEHCDLCPETAARQLALTPEWARAHWIAAIRELVEEAGILLAREADHRLARSAQQHLQQTPEAFLAFCQQQGLLLDTGRIRYLSRWITPAGNPRRYDTRFFLCPWPGNQSPNQDNHEAVNTAWVTPAQALDHYHRGRWELVLPTLTTLRQLQSCADSASALDTLGQAMAGKTR